MVQTKESPLVYVYFREEEEARRGVLLQRMSQDMKSEYREINVLETHALLSEARVVKSSVFRRSVVVFLVEQEVVN